MPPDPDDRAPDADAGNPPDSLRPPRDDIGDFRTMPLDAERPFLEQFEERAEWDPECRKWLDTEVYPNRALMMELDPLYFTRPAGGQRQGCTPADPSPQGTSAPVDAQLDVARQALVAAFPLILTLATPARGEQAVLSFDESCLHVELAGVTVTAPATGVWSGQARVAAHAILALARMPPHADPLRLRVQGGMLHVGGVLSVSCYWQPAWSASIQLPMNADMAMLLALRLKYSPEQIEASGLKLAVADADAVCTQRAANASLVLREYGVTAKDVRALVDHILRARGVLDTV